MDGLALSDGNASGAKASDPARRARPRLRPALAWTATPLMIWVAVVLLARARGLAVVAHDSRAALAFPPLAARFDPRFPWTAVLCFVCPGLLVAAGPGVCAGMRWRRLLLLAFLATAVWAVALAQVDGVAGLTGDANYLHDVPSVGHPVSFLSAFVSNLGKYTQHVRAHPPGFVLLLWGMRGIGLGGSGAEGALVILAGAAAVPAALLAAREMAGERVARSSAPFLVVAPVALWTATSADALFMGVTAWAVALIILATGRTGTRSLLLALEGGLLFGCSLLLSYGMLLLALVPVGAAVYRRRAAPPAVAAAGACIALGAFATAGFWWPDGLHASLEQYRASAAQFRPQSAFALINLGAFALALGPGTSVALARLRDRRLWILVGCALLAVAIADLTGLSKAEAERIWLPFAPWILLAGASLDGDLPSSRPWIAMQVASCILLQLTIRGP